jgi:hypothetical protein
VTKREKRRRGGGGGKDDTYHIRRLHKTFSAISPWDEVGQSPESRGQDHRLGRVV